MNTDQPGPDHPSVGGSGHDRPDSAGSRSRDRGALPAIWPEHHRPDGTRCPWSNTTHRTIGVPCPAGCGVASLRRASTAGRADDPGTGQGQP
ncbi:MAG: hypothetical protein ACRCYU_02565 [Nocardioides sp.]